MKALLLALTLCAGHRYSQTDAQQLFDAANAAYFKGDYEAAVGQYQKLAEDGWSSADLDYNLGTALLAQGKLGQSILALERARRLSPTDEDVQANLERARHELVDKVAGAGEEPFVARVAALLPVGIVGWAFLGAWLCFWLGVLGRRFARGPAVALSALGAIAVVASGALLGVQWYEREQMHEAVVIGATVPAREGPNAASKVSFELHEGTELRIIDREGSFLRVRLRNGLEGWADATGVEEI